MHFPQGQGISTLATVVFHIIPQQSQSSKKNKDRKKKKKPFLFLDHISLFVGRETQKKSEGKKTLKNPLHACIFNEIQPVFIPFSQERWKATLAKARIRISEHYLDLQHTAAANLSGQSSAVLNGVNILDTASQANEGQSEAHLQLPLHCPQPATKSPGLVLQPWCMPP